MPNTHWIGVSPADTVIHYGGVYEDENGLRKFLESQGCNLTGWHFILVDSQKYFEDLE